MNADYNKHLDLTNDVGATVRAEREHVYLYMGGDLSISIGFAPDRARELAAALIAAADTQDKESQ